MTRPERRSAILLAGALFFAAALLFSVMLSPGFLLPSNTAQLFEGDWAQHYLAWEFYRDTPWQFPLGTLEGYNHPVTTSIGYTDSIPLMAALFRLFSPLLPDDFQYIGLWFFICFLLQAAFGALLVRSLGFRHPATVFFGAVFLLLSPVLLFRVGHPALCAHWLILGSLWVYMNRWRSPWSGVAWQAAFVLLGAWIHPYLAMVAFSALLAFIARRVAVDKGLNWWSAAITVAVAAGLALLIWYSIGYFNIRAADIWETGGGFTDYSANLLGFVNPFEFSLLLPDIALPGEGHREGFAFLGLGALFLIAVLALTIGSRKSGRQQAQEKRTWKWYLPLLAVVACWTLFAFSNEIYAGHHLVLAYPLPGWADRFTQTFRASGRFIWLLVYTVYLFIFLGLKRLNLKARTLPLLIALVCAVQLVDAAPLLKPHFDTPHPYEFPLSQEWHDAVAGAQTIVMVPPFQRQYIEAEDYIVFVYLAHMHHLPITTGYVARRNAGAEEQYQQSLDAALASGRPDQGAVYVTTPGQEQAFGRWMQEGYVERRQLDGYVVFWPVNDVP